IPEGNPKLAELQAEYRDILTSSTDGWYIEYAASPEHGAVSILMKFLDDERVEIVSDLNGFQEEKISTYRVGGVNRPELIFDTYSVWSVLAESFGGKFEFLIEPQEDGTILLKNIYVDKNREFVLREAEVEDRDLITEKTNTARMLQSFNDNASAYFRNLVLDDISAFWEMNVAIQRLKLTWLEGGEVKSEEFSYTNGEQAIILSKPWATGSVQVSEFKFGTPTSNALEVTEAGTAGAGQVEVAHVPAFPYEGTADRYIDSNLDRPNETLVRLLGYTVSPEVGISEALRPYYDAVTNALPTFWRVQVYNYSPVDAPRNYLVFVGKDAEDKNTFYNFYYALTKADESHVVPVYENANTLGQIIVDHPDVQAFLNRIYPPEGVTIVPIASNICRVVSRANSNYWMQLTISTPTNPF